MPYQAVTPRTVTRPSSPPLSQRRPVLAGEHRRLVADLLVAPAAHAVELADDLLGRHLRGALLHGVGAARLEGAARRPAPGARREAGDALERAPPAEHRDRVQQAPRVRVAGAGEQLGRRADLHEPPRVHDGDAVGELRHDREVVRHVHGRGVVGLSGRGWCRARAPGW